LLLSDCEKFLTVDWIFCSGEGNIEKHMSGTIFMGSELKHGDGHLSVIVYGTYLLSEFIMS